MNEISKSDGLSPEQKAFLFLKLALKSPYTEIKQEFEQFFESKINGDVIIALKARFKDEIDLISETELNSLDGNPLCHPRVRLDIIYKCLQEAMTPKATGSYREGPIGSEEYKIEKDINHTAIKNYLDLAQKEEYLSKKLLLEYMKAKEDGLTLDKPKTGFKPIKVNANLIWDD